MKLIYNVKDKPKFGQLIVFAIQQLLAIMAATLVVPVIIGNGMSPAAALLGAGVGTLVYLTFTKFKSPVFLGSSFAFLGSMAAAFAGATSVALGYLGLIIGAALAGAVYVVIALAVKFAGVNWLNKLMPPVVIGPTVAIIGLSLAGNAVGDLQAPEAGLGGNWGAVVFMAMVTGAGGGLLRDVMINQVPMVLTRRIYALAALIGGGTYYVLQQHIDSAAASFVATAVVFTIRMLATKYLWNLPRAID